MNNNFIRVLLTQMTSVNRSNYQVINTSTYYSSVFNEIHYLDPTSGDSELDPEGSLASQGSWSSMESDLSELWSFDRTVMASMMMNRPSSST
ncbi:hypothetical protein HYC85_008075 [Camellia sinensis]|uniref:Uncharacterized protein n=1 Tax=Camellia sinensis TaxID=4442 RepID=A0A7J7HRG4_CAMSI|nr:hypothetical protein HYC85_008075 [Camellia sinensis]